MPKYGRWEDAMITQMALWEWTQTTQGMRYTLAFEADMNSKHPEKHRLPVGFLWQLHPTKVFEFRR